MAIARATCTCATCGQTFEIKVYKRNTAEATSFEKWAESHITECKACEEKRIEAKRLAEAEAASAAAKEAGWPELTGSEKQIRWAATIRDSEISEVAGKTRPDRQWLLDACVTALVNEKTVAAWWIDNRGCIGSIIHKMARERFANGEAQAREQAEAEAAAKEDTATIAVPEERKHDGEANITASEEKVSVTYPKDEAFRALVKALGYRWDAASASWYLTISEKTGTAAERAAELGSRLLNAGFAVRIQDPETLRNAVEGRYEPMCQRWIDADDGQKCFVITWGADDLYEKARSLPHSRYSFGRITVPYKELEAVREFAHTYGFRMTAKAQATLDRHDAATVVVKPAEAKRPQYDEHPTSEVLASSREVLDDLKDEEG